MTDGTAIALLGAAVIAIVVVCVVTADRRWKKELAARDAVRAEQRNRRDQLIAEVEADGRYQSYLTKYHGEPYICTDCGCIVLHRPTHDAWHADRKK